MRTYCDHDQEPNRKANRIGTVRVVTFPSGGGKARETHPFTIAEAITFFDPFQRSEAR